MANETCTVSLVSLTKPQIEGINTAEELIAYTARVSNPSNQMNNETAPRLLKYLLDNKHYSPFEQVDVGVEIQTSRGIAPQILRHWSFSFSEFCVAGDTEIYFDTPAKLSRGRRNLLKVKISDLYRRFRSNPKSYSRSMVRIWDETQNKFSHAKFTGVFKTGIKPVYKITLACGKSITATKEHKFLTQSGWQTLQEAVGLETIGDTPTMSKETFLAVNGTPPHQSKEWMAEAKAKFKDVKLIADEANVSYHTIRKWLKKHKLSFTKKEVAEAHPIWNKGKFGYKTSLKLSEKHLAAIRAARSGKKCNFYKDGRSSERHKIQASLQGLKKKMMVEGNYTCSWCKKQGGLLELHHIVPVSENRDLATEPKNLVIICRACHRNHHKTEGHLKMWKERSRGNLLVIRWSKVEKIEYLGEQETYDLEIDHISHNYVANGIVTHNSQRYSEAADFIKYPARRQDTKNRQNSIDDLPAETKKWFEDAQQFIWDICYDRYKQALDMGIAKEQARFILPLNTKTKLYMKGNVRDWIFYLLLRSGNGTQLEHQEIAKAIINTVFVPNFPVISEVLGWK